MPVLFLPIGTAILFLFGRIFALLSDPLSAAILDGTALLIGVLWCFSLVLLLVCTACLLLRQE